MHGAEGRLPTPLLTCQANLTRTLQNGKLSKPFLEVPAVPDSQAWDGSGCQPCSSAL